MLQTINGFDLLLIIIITILGFKVYNLKQETKSMTTGLTNIMNELIIPLQKLVDHHSGCNCKDCYIRVQPPLDKGIYDDVCNYCLGISGSGCTCKPDECFYCLGIEEFVTGNECYCKSI